MITSEVEIWKDVVDFEGIYQVSSYGRIKILSREVEVKKNGTIPPSHRGCNLPNAKVTIEQVVEIRNSSNTAKQLALRYGITVQAVYNILGYRTFKNVKNA